MAHTIVPGECISATERFLNCAKIALDFVLSLIVDSVLVPSQIVGTRKDGVARLASARVDAVATVRTSLTVQYGRCEAVIWRTTKIMRLAMSFALVFL